MVDHLYLCVFVVFKYEKMSLKLGFKIEQLKDESKHKFISQSF